jgi:hypothetical protein
MIPLKLFFADRSACALADDQSLILKRTKEALLASENVTEVYHPDVSDVIVIQEKNSFKNFNYVHDLLKDPLVSKHASRIFTLNEDDCATGLLKGLYTSLPKFRYQSSLHRAVPYMQFPNEIVFQDQVDIKPEYLASWRGNIKSNPIRIKLLNSLECASDVVMQKTDSWLNHAENEKAEYVRLIKDARFSLCPSGWAPVSFRIYESMALGRCPVILADNFVPPAGPDWSKFALFYPENKVTSLYRFLQLEKDNSEELGNYALIAWNKYFSEVNIGSYYAHSLLSLLKDFTPVPNALEINRWRSLGSYWKNEWTLPQRLVNRLRRLEVVKQFTV